MNNSQAKTLVDSIVADPFRSLYLRAIAKLESSYGDGFPGKHNWGAITTGSAWEGEFFEHKDKRWNPETGSVEEYSTYFRAYPDDESGVRDLDKLLSSRYERAYSLGAKALRTRDSNLLRQASDALYGYYRGVLPTRAENVDAHYSRTVQVLADIISDTGELKGGASKGISPVLLIGGGVATIITLAFIASKRK